MIVVRILGVMVLFPIVALGYGIQLTRGWKHRDLSGTISWYILGSFAILALFTLVSIPFTMVGRPFHELCYAGIIITVLGVVFFLYDIIVKHGWNYYHAWLWKVLKVIRKYWWIVLPAIVILFQIGRSVWKTPVIYSDDKIYIDRINDMIYLDTILETDTVTGAVSEAARLSSPKFVLSSWLQFLAVICSLAGVHPLILIKSVFPIFMISFHYLIIYRLTFYLSPDYKKRILMMLFYSLLMEFGSVSLRTDYSYYLFTWSWYGKTYYQFAVIPVIILFFLFIQKHETNWRDGMIIMMLSTAGLGSSATALMLLPVQMALLIFFECIAKKSVRELWISVPALLPIAAGAAIYFVMF